MKCNIYSEFKGRKIVYPAASFKYVLSLCAPSGRLVYAESRWSILVEKVHISPKNVLCTGNSVVTTFSVASIVGST